MVAISNGVKTFRVPAGSIKPYRSMGFYVVQDGDFDGTEEQVYRSETTTKKPTKVKASESSAVEPKVKAEPDEDKADEMFVEELLEKPLSQWSNDEVKEFVRIKDIDTTGAQKVSQVRNIIKAYLEEQNKNA